MFALGGRAFTKSLADRLDLPFSRAEQVKIDFSRGLPVDDAKTVEAVLSEDTAVWAAGVELVLEELAGGDLLPGRIYVCGGGSRLAHLVKALRDERFAKRLPFSRPPEVTIMEPGEIEAIVDTTKLLVDQQDVTPLGLAYQAIEMSSQEQPLDAALRRVLRAMKV
jgi:cell division protein FtsA